jgi:hypothetical protein
MIHGAGGSMNKFMSLHCNGRARIALTSAILVPPVLIPVVIGFGVTPKDFDAALLLWSFLVVGVVTAVYCVFAASRLLSWMAQGITEAERRSYILAGRWTLGAIVILVASTGVALHRYEIIPLPTNSPAARYKLDRWTGKLMREGDLKDMSAPVAVRQKRLTAI